MQELKTKHLFIVSPFYTAVQKISQAEISQDKNTVATFVLNKRVKLLCFTWNNSWSQTLTDVANMVDLIQVNYISVASKYLISPVNITWQGRLAARRIMTSCQKSHEREKLKKNNNFTGSCLRRNDASTKCVIWTWEIVKAVFFWESYRCMNNFFTHH